MWTRIVIFDINPFFLADVGDFDPQKCRSTNFNPVNLVFPFPLLRYTPVSPSTGLPGVSQILVGSCDKFSSQINVVTLRRADPRVTEVISLAECKITAMAVVPGTPGSAVNDAVSSSDPSTHIFPTETLWVAAKSRRLTVYSLATREEITSFTACESVTVIRVHNDKVFFGIFLVVVAGLFSNSTLRSRP